MGNVIIKINDLNCSYNENEGIVLNVNDLTIEKGYIYAILGESGSGKSTFLETIGMMNKTFDTSTKSNNPITFFSKERVYPYKDLWSDKSSKLISSIRNRHFSFIFQKTNLMPKFFWYENVCLTSLLQNKSYCDSLNALQKKLKQLGLENLEFDFSSNSKNTNSVFNIKKIFNKKAISSNHNTDKFPRNFSGGQQQRFAFLRAILPDFTILFGDEPTGNLDEANSGLLMKDLRENISEHQCAIIVTHNINIALKFADRIIYIRKVGNSEKFIGQIKKEDMLICRTQEVSDERDWRDQDNKIITKKIIKGLLKEYVNE